MNITEFYQAQGDRFQVSREQASRFAKEIAGDFNPLHDLEAKRFCVPGDLLFGLTLHHFGLCQHMHFTFQGMVTEEQTLAVVNTAAGQIALRDHQDKDCLVVQHEGNCTQDLTLISELTQRYVEFSGHTFPHLLVPLMQEKKMMINPDRPMVIYENMILTLDRLDFTSPSLALSSNELEITGKRGRASMKFEIQSDQGVVGRGEKNFLLSGLKEYDEKPLMALVNNYEAMKAAYHTA